MVLAHFLRKIAHFCTIRPEIGIYLSVVYYLAPLTPGSSVGKLDLIQGRVR